MTRITQTILLVTVFTTLGFMALPQRPLTHAEALALRTEHSLITRLETVRGAVEQYRRDHGEWPGHPPNSGLAGTADSTWVIRQLCMATNSQGEVAPASEPEFPFGPYLAQSDLTNPVNNLAGFTLYHSQAAQHLRADDTTAWYFNTANGDVHLNAAGFITGTNLRYTEL